MNIFFLHTNPVIAALMMCDKHVIKMILESVQLLWAAQYSVSPNLSHLKPYLHELDSDRPYKKTHFNHPSSIWVRSDISHYSWLIKHVSALHQIYYDHFGHKIHKCFSHITFLAEHPPFLPASGLFNFPPQAMPDNYKSDNAFQSYRQYYVNDKMSFISYRCTREIPGFLYYHAPEIKVTHQSKKKVCEFCVNLKK